MLVLPLPAAPPISHLASCTNFSMLPLFSFSVCTPPPNKPITLPLILDNLCTPHLPVSHPDSILSPPTLLHLIVDLRVVAMSTSQHITMATSVSETRLLIRERCLV